MIRWQSWMSVALLAAGTALGGEAEPGRQAVAVDELTGLKIAPGWEHARAHCGACHSWRLVTGNRGDQDSWLALIRWMQDTQKLWPIPEPTLTELVDYLAAAYPPGTASRRAPLASHLLPPLTPVPAGLSEPDS